jgi:murein DD-endopeptidase MepM/ murein hydrolase activator NlpD
MARRLLAISASVFVITGCATQKATMTFAEAGFFEPEESDEPPAPPVSTATFRAKIAEPPPGPPVDGALLRFATEARERRGRVAGGRGFPADAVASWQALLVELDRYLRRPLHQTPLLELVRARVTIEAELENDRSRYGEPPEGLEPRIGQGVARLARRMTAARALGYGLFAPVAPSVLQWPIEHAGLASLFGPRLHPIDHVRKMHYGVDLAAPSGTVVLSAGGGFVTHAGWAAGYGLMVEVHHPGALTTRYGHLSRIFCYPGDELGTGQLLGLVGATGKATGPHLHFEVWQDGRASDPLALLGGPASHGSEGN